MNRRKFLWPTCVLTAIVVTSSMGAAQIDGVLTARASFNPTLDQTTSFTIAVNEDVTLTAVVLDRDGFVVRQLITDASVQRGNVTLRWDGKDDAGSIVPDEAYSIKVDVRGGSGTDSYFPAAQPARFFALAADFYDRRTGVLRYTLEQAARVHIQAGATTINPQTKQPDGPVLRTIVNRSPRPAGAVVETWTGMDEGGSIHVPSLPNFVIAIAATALPENAVITTGNRRSAFVDAAASRRGISLLPHTRPGHHHQGLTALEDTAPALSVNVANGEWSPVERLWTTSANSARLRIALDGSNASAFAQLPATVMVFVNQRKVAEVRSSGESAIVHVPLTVKPGDSSVVAVNWVTESGPVALTAFRLQRKATT